MRLDRLGPQLRHEQKYTRRPASDVLI
jgi:hypothetical protein